MFHEIVVESSVPERIPDEFWRDS